MSKPAKITYSIIIPAYREEVVIRQSLQDVRDFLADWKYGDETEVIVVTADSPDKTQQYVAEAAEQFKHFQHINPGPKVGKGRDVSAGMQAARGSYMLFTDADLATPLKYIPEAFDMLQSADVVIGNRDLDAIHTGFRYLISNITNILVQLIILPGIRDTQCGFKAFSAESGKAIFDSVRIHGWGFDMEVLKIARTRKLKIATVDIPDWSDPKLDAGLSGESVIKASIKTFTELLTIRWNSWLRRYR